MCIRDSSYIAQKKNRKLQKRVSGFCYSCSSFKMCIRDRRTRTTVPVHLQDAHYGGHEKLGKGIGYKYAHNYPNHYVDQQYLPTEIQNERFYELSDMGYEKTLKEHMEKIRH